MYYALHSFLISIHPTDQAPSRKHSSSDLGIVSWIAISRIMMRSSTCFDLIAAITAASKRQQSQSVAGIPNLG